MPATADPKTTTRSRGRAKTPVKASPKPSPARTAGTPSKASPVPPKPAADQPVPLSVSEWLMAVAACFCAIAYVANTTSLDRDMATNVKGGLMCYALIFFIAINIMRRINAVSTPSVGKTFVATVAMLYLLAACVILGMPAKDPTKSGCHPFNAKEANKTVDDACWQSQGDGRAAMQYFDRKLGIKLPETSYAADCRLTKENLLGVFDEFVVAHLLGWWAKTLMLRSHVLAWLMSIVFEYMEITFQQYMDNFLECWWDHIVADLLVCNLLGMILGFWTIRHCAREGPNGSLFSRFMHSVWPFGFDMMDWNPLGSPNNLAHTLLCLAIIQVCDVNGFWIKYVLWMAPPHGFNIFRLMFFWLLGTGALNEYHAYAIARKAPAPGLLGFLTACALGIELFIAWNYRQGMFPVANAAFIWRLWILAAIGFAIWAFAFFRSGDHIRYGGSLTTRQTALLALAVGPWALLLFAKGCPLLPTTSLCVYNKDVDPRVYPGFSQDIPPDNCFQVFGGALFG